MDLREYETAINKLVVADIDRKSIKCPHCGESYYAERYSTSTCMGFIPIYKDGVLVNKDPNTTTTYCYCIGCNKEFTYKSGNNEEKYACLFGHQDDVDCWSDD